MEQELVQDAEQQPGQQKKGFCDLFIQAKQHVDYQQTVDKFNLRNLRERIWKEEEYNLQNIKTIEVGIDFDETEMNTIQLS